MNIKYVNHLNEELDLSGVPYLLQNCDAFDYSWEPSMVARSDNKSKVESFKRTSKKFTAELLIKDDDFTAAVNRFFEITEKDIVANELGRLVLESGEYLPCFITESKHTGFHLRNRWDNRQLAILSPHPFWVKEITRTFLPGISTMEQQYLDYDHDYNYDYASGVIIDELNVPHYSACDFEMVIYGPCDNPRVVIGDNVYEVFDTISSGEYIVIDSRKHSVVKYRTNGTTLNLYDMRGKKRSVFDKIPAGNSSVSRNSEFGFDLKLFIERSEPKTW